MDNLKVVDKVKMFRVVNKGEMSLYLASDIGPLMELLMHSVGNNNGEHYVELVGDPQEVQAVVFGVGDCGAGKMVNGATMIADFIQESEQKDSNESSILEAPFARFLFSSTASNVWLKWSSFIYYGNELQPEKEFGLKA